MNEVMTKIINDISSNNMSLFSPRESIKVFLKDDSGEFFTIPLMSVKRVECEREKLYCDYIDTKVSIYMDINELLKFGSYYYVPAFVSRYTDRIKKVIFNDPATIILWKDGTKTVVKCAEGETYDPEKGFAMAFIKYHLGNDNQFHKLFKKYMPKEEKE